MAMETKITRRDLLNGIVIGAGGSFLQAYSGRAVGNPAGTVGFEPNVMPSYYPPTLTGMHGSLARSINGVLVSCVDLIVLGTSTGHLGRWFEGAKF